jgi:hypothetical protein
VEIESGDALHEELAGLLAPDQAMAGLESMCSKWGLIAFGKRFQFAELEYYYFNPATHPDSFVHCHELQSLFGRWYFHRVGSGYKGGSFKGLDISFGTGGSFGGVLIRSLILEQSEELISGPSLCVDALLAAAGLASVAELDARVGHLHVWDSGSDLRLVPLDVGVAKVSYRTERVGLPTGDGPDQKARQDFRKRRYRLLTEPRRIKKGRPLLLSALLEDGRSPEEVKQLTGSPLGTIKKRLLGLESGD